MRSYQNETKNFDRNFQKLKKAAVYGLKSVLLDESHGVRLALAAPFIYDRFGGHFFVLLMI